MPALDSTEGSEHVRKHGLSYTPESLVYVIREAIDKRNTALVEVSFRFLIGREVGAQWEGGHCEGTMVLLARTFGFHLSRELRVAFRSRCLASLSEAIYAGREVKPYWEERFGDAFKKVCIDAARWLSLPRNRDMEAGVTGDGDDATDVDNFDFGKPLIDVEIVEQLSKPHHQAVVLRAVRALPSRQGQAVMLAWMEGRAIEGQAAGTVAEVMAISPTAVYKLLRKALPILRANSDLQAIWLGDK